MFFAIDRHRDQFVDYIEELMRRAMADGTLVTPSGARYRSRLGSFGHPLRYGTMLVFLDFEASSLGKRGVPIEVAWVFEDGRSEAHLIRPAPSWTDWDDAAEAIHHIPRDRLLRDGADHDVVARRMVAELTGHDLLASAPSWDGKWLSALLRAGGLDRRALRLRDSDDARRECATAILAPVVPANQLATTVGDLLALIDVRAAGHTPAHRALADAGDERRRWLVVGQAARALAEDLSVAG